MTEDIKNGQDLANLAESAEKYIRLNYRPVVVQERPAEPEPAEAVYPEAVPSQDAYGDFCSSDVRYSLAKSSYTAVNDELLFSAYNDTIETEFSFLGNIFTEMTFVDKLREHIRLKNMREPECMNTT